MTDTTFAVPASDAAPRWPVRYLLFIAGLGGLLYGIDTVSYTHLTLPTKA